MNVSGILDFIDNGHMALPEFQRGYVWNRDQVRAFMDSLYRRHPVGSLLVWATKSDGAPHRGDGRLAPGVVKLLLDGQQRMTSLYGIIRGKPPRFFDGHTAAFSGLRFHLGKEEFAFYSPVYMKDDPLWIDVSTIMLKGNDGVGEYVKRLSVQPDLAVAIGTYIGRINQILGIRDIQLHIEEVTGEDKTIDVVVDIFNRVNSGGTKLSKGDLALAKICADWPEARDQMRVALARWRDGGFHFDLDWLLRCVNTIVTGEAKFLHLHDVASDRVQEGLKRAERGIDALLNIISGRLGLDHDRVFFGRYALPVMVHYLDRRGGQLADATERDKLLYWYLNAAMWGRFSGSTESYIDKDLKVLEELNGGLDRLIDELRLWHGGLGVQPGHFGGWSRGARFYPMLYLLTRIGEAKDWGLGIPLKDGMLGKMNQLEVHHIFPKSRLYKHGYRRPEVNAVANFCFLTKETNLKISNRRPEEYFPEIERNHPGALTSQWIPIDPELWRIDRYLDFLEARKILLANAANAFLAELLHGEALPEPAAEPQAEEPAPVVGPVAVPGEVAKAAIPGGIGSEEEEEILFAVEDWVEKQGLPEGELSFELSDQNTGDPVAMFDLVWEKGLQEGLSQPVALLLNEPPEILAVANAHGYRYFTDVESFKHYVTEEILAIHEPVAAVAAM